jgi:hypothetical protein
MRAQRREGAELNLGVLGVASIERFLAETEAADLGESDHGAMAMLEPDADLRAGL